MTIIIQTLSLLKSRKVGIFTDMTALKAPSFADANNKHGKCYPPWNYVTAFFIPLIHIKI